MSIAATVLEQYEHQPISREAIAIIQAAEDLTRAKSAVYVHELESQLRMAAGALRIMGETMRDLDLPFAASECFNEYQNAMRLLDRSAAAVLNVPMLKRQAI